jgi:hypothetical protein
MGFSASMSDMLPTKGRPGGPGMVAVSEDMICSEARMGKCELDGDRECTIEIYVGFQNAALVLWRSEVPGFVHA